MAPSAHWPVHSSKEVASRHGPSVASQPVPLLFALPILIGLTAQMDAREPMSADALQELVNRLKDQLGIDAVVSAAIVPSNPLLVSVQRVDGAPATFQMAFEKQFLAGLDADDLKAIVAHELGHVWIFTHHPYLQTERLANTVAMRAVSRDSLERVYNKVWEREGSKERPGALPRAAVDVLPLTRRTIEPPMCGRDGGVPSRAAYILARTITSRFTERRAEVNARPPSVPVGLGSEPTT